MTRALILSLLLAVGLAVLAGLLHVVGAALDVGWVIAGAAAGAGFAVYLAVRTAGGGRGAPGAHTRAP